MKFRHVGRFYAKARGPPLSVHSSPTVKQHGRTLLFFPYDNTKGRRSTHQEHCPFTAAVHTARKEFTGVFSVRQ